MGSSDESSRIAEREGVKSSLDDELLSESADTSPAQALVQTSKKRKCCRQDKPWEAIADQMPDFGDDPSGKKEYMWKLNAMPKLKPSRVSVAIVWSLIMAMLDMSIVSVALVKLTEYFHKTSSEIQWVSDGYSIFLAAVAIIAGKIGDRYGSVLVNRITIVCFVVFSVTCTLAGPDTYWILVLSRCLQGISASFLMSTNMSLATTLVAPIDIAGVMAWTSGITTIAVAIGPLLGGFLVEYMGWQFIFLINVPIGIVGLILTSVLLPMTPRLNEKKFDILGGILTLLFLALLVFGITRLVEQTILGVICIAVSIVLIVIFCFWEKRHICPMMPGDVLFNYRVITSLMSGMFSFATMALCTYQAPFMMQFGWGYSAVLSGVCTLPNTITMGAVSIWAGSLNRKYASLFLKTLANVVSVCGVIVFAFSGFGGISVLIIGTVFLAGGLILYVSASNNYIMVITPINSKGTMGGCVQCFRETGFSLGVALSCLFQDAIYSMIWGDDVPTGEVMPTDFYDAYKYTFLYMALSFMALISIAAVLTQVSGCHAYELEHGFKFIPKSWIPQLQKDIDVNRAKGLDALGFPLKKPQIPKDGEGEEDKLEKANTEDKQ